MGVGFNLKAQFVIHMEFQNFFNVLIGLIEKGAQFFTKVEFIHTHTTNTALTTSKPPPSAIQSIWVIKAGHKVNGMCLRLFFFFYFNP